jgi:GT2 family glycosyltransferase
MKVSVLLPVFNGASTLGRAIESILRQEMADFELLVIDDASTDASFAVAEAFAKQDSRVRVLRHPRNLGLPATLNEGLELAAAEFVARMDHDDESLPLRLGMQHLFLSTRPHVAACGSLVYHMGSDSTKDRLVTLPTVPEEVGLRLERENCLYHPAVMMRREAVRAIGGYRPEFKNAEDYDLWLRLASRHKLANVPVALLRYHLSVGGQTLARKWEQLYFVRLAQVAHRHPQLSLEAAGEQARVRLQAENRTEFLTSVARQTAEELAALGQPAEAEKLLDAFGNELGAWRFAALRTKLAAARGADPRQSAKQTA